MPLCYYVFWFSMYLTFTVFREDVIGPLRDSSVYSSAEVPMFICFRLLANLYSTVLYVDSGGIRGPTKYCSK